jgi:uncharacterized protein YraI
MQTQAKNKIIQATLAILLVLGTAVFATGAAPSAHAASSAQSAALQQTGTVAARMVNARSGPGVSFSTLGQLKQGDRVEIVARQGNWYQVVYTAAAGGTAWVRSDYIQPGQPARATQAAAQSDKSLAGAGAIVFQTRNGGDIFLMNADGTELRKLTTGFEPALSPDGAQVAFTRFAEPMGLYVINADGSNERLVFGANRPRSPSWTSDGQSIIVEWSPNSRECYVTMFGCLTEEEWYTRTDGSGCMPGRDQPVCLNDFPKYSLYDTNLSRVDLATGAVRDLPASHTAVAPDQNAQDDRVLFLDKDGLATTRNEGNDPAQRVVKLPNLVGEAVFSPDGRFIYGMRKLHDHWEIWRWNANGSGGVALTTPQALAAKPVNNVAPTVSPDGRQVAFLTDRTGPWELWVMNADGSNQRPLASQALGGITFQYDNNSDRMVDWGK